MSNDSTPEKIYSQGRRMKLARVREDSSPPHSLRRSFLFTLEGLLDVFWCNRFGSLKREAERTVPEQLAQRPDPARDSEQDRVVVVLLEVVMPEENTRVRIDVRPRILGLAVLGEDVGNNLKDGRNNLEELVVRHVLQSEFSLARHRGTLPQTLSPIGTP